MTTHPAQNNQLSPGVPRIDNHMSPQTPQCIQHHHQEFRKRVVFCASQLEELDKEFRINKYPNKPRRVTLAQSLGLTEYQVQIWFQNRRQRFKEEQLRAYQPI
uniref:Homeobox protein HOX3 n=1 Tax=Lygus hesperus TaxID=30085 RepID=A0A146KVW9_LYGHE